MPKGITECLQALGLLAQGPKVLHKNQWPKTAKTMYGLIKVLIASIEEDHAKRPNERIMAHAVEWVEKYKDLWTLEHRHKLFPHAPLYPTEKLIIASWVEELIQEKLRQSCHYHKHRNRLMGAKNLPGGGFHDDNQIQGITSEGPVSQTQDNEETTEASDGASERAASVEGSSQDEEAADFNQSSASHTTTVDASFFGPIPMLQASDFNAVVSYRSPEPHPTQSDDPYEKPRSSFVPKNVFTSLAYPHIAFPESMFSRILFLVQPSEEHSQSAGRIMGLPEAQVFESFRNGALERLEGIGERIGSRKLVAKFEMLPTSFLVQNSHDHYFMLAFVKSWAEWKSPSLCVVCISLENKA